MTRLLVVLVVAATALFVAGVAAERARGETGRAPVAHHTETEGGETGGEAAEGGHASESVAGVNAESWPLVALAAAASLALAAAVWRRPGWRLALALTAGAMALFALLDVREVAHQLAESAVGLAVVAAAVAALHGAAAAVAVMMYRS
jgi:hypothetical protein